MAILAILFALTTFAIRYLHEAASRVGDARELDTLLDPKAPAATESPQPVELNLIVNGSFERGALSSLDFSTVGVGSPAIEGWAVTKNTVDWCFSYWDASDGVRSLDMNGSPGPGAIRQTFATIPGQEYVLTFDMAANPAGSPWVVLRDMAVRVAGVSQVFTIDRRKSSPRRMNWDTKTLTFTATGTTTTLEFESLTQNFYYGPAIDNVRVIPASK